MDAMALAPVLQGNRLIGTATMTVTINVVNGVTIDDLFGWTSNKTHASISTTVSDDSIFDIQTHADYPLYPSHIYVRNVSSNYITVCSAIISVSTAGSLNAPYNYYTIDLDSHIYESLVTPFIIGKGGGLSRVISSSTYPNSGINNFLKASGLTNVFLVGFRVWMYGYSIMIDVQSSTSANNIISLTGAQYRFRQ